MPKIFNSGWFAQAFVLFVGGFSVHTVYATCFSEVDAIGYEVVLGCKHPCLESSSIVYECFHVNPLETAVCSPDFCLRSGVTYAHCKVGEVSAEEPQCMVHEDATEVGVQQWVHGVLAPLTCTDNGPEELEYPMYPFSGPCVFNRKVMGKCLQSGCPGPVLHTGTPRLGRKVCGP